MTCVSLLLGSRHGRGRKRRCACEPHREFFCNFFVLRAAIVCFSREQSKRPITASIRSTAPRRSQKGRRERRSQRRYDEVIIPDPFGSIALQFVRGFLAAYLNTLFCVTMAWLLPQLQVSIADITWALFEGIAKVWLNGVVVAILFGLRLLPSWLAC